MEDSMGVLPLRTDLGELEILEVYVYYDQPRLFSCRDATGMLYVAVAVEQRGDSDVWLYIRVSLDRLQSIRRDEIDLREAILGVKGGPVYQVETPFSDEPATACVLPAERIPEKWLPEPGAFLEFDASPLSPFVTYGSQRDSFEVPVRGGISQVVVKAYCRQNLRVTISENTVDDSVMSRKSEEPYPLTA